MKSIGKFSVIMLALAFSLGFTYIANAGIGGSADQQTEQATNRPVTSDNENLKVVPVVSWSEPGVVTKSSKGAVRVDRDFGAYHQDDLNQFGDDRAYDSSEGHKNKESDYQAHHWIPDTYGLMGNYSYDEK